MSKNAINAAGFHHVALKAPDLDRAVAFYHEGLGMPIKARWEGGCMIDTGDGACMEIFPGGSGAYREDGFYHIALAVPDVDAAVATALAAGAELTVEPKDIALPSQPPVKARIAFVRGVAGESIEFFSEEK